MIDLSFQKYWYILLHNVQYSTVQRKKKHKNDKLLRKKRIISAIHVHLGRLSFEFYNSAIPSSLEENQSSKEAKYKRILVNLKKYMPILEHLNDI